MRRSVAVVGVLMLLAACSGAGLMTTRPAVEQFLVPGATNVQVIPVGWNEWQISYHSPGSPTSWYTDVAQQLEAQHWSSPDHVAYGSLTRTYSHAISLGCCELWEWAFLTFDPLRPRDAQIRVRRWVAFSSGPGQLVPHRDAEQAVASGRRYCTAPTS